ncbi:hypothetical protein BD410DRAFT_509757 [Rickenella mellea]|uniref:Uncharacterized protein n=1 Tax=Rickenella mellea TaxID=50990 RepID=A0A4Y7PTD8_9AGAM|nr:hypothetical protein BD410DRAFT_509757 [Rickenella mellea]
MVAGGRVFVLGAVHSSQARGTVGAGCWRACEQAVGLLALSRAPERAAAWCCVLAGADVHASERGPAFAWGILRLVSKESAHKKKRKHTYNAAIKSIAAFYPTREQREAASAADSSPPAFRFPFVVVLAPFVVCRCDVVVALLVVR